MKAQFPASLEHLHEMLAFVERRAQLAGFEGQPLTAIELAVEEALVNVIKHGYLDHVGMVTINCSLVDGQNFTIELIDQGVAYNPLENQQMIDRTLPAESRPIGGYGVFLILQLVDKASYRREQNSNILTLVKWLPRT